MILSKIFVYFHFFSDVSMIVNMQLDLSNQVL